MSKQLRTEIAFGCLWAIVLAAAGASGETVKKTAETFDDVAWVNDLWNTGLGKTSLSSDVAPGCSSKRSLRFQSQYSGKGFEGVRIKPPQPLVIPGDVKTVVIRVKRADAHYGLKMHFRDGWGREKANNQPLVWDLRLADTPQWQTCTFNVPDHWVKPVTIAAVETHNWETQGLANTVTFLLDHLEVETDISQVDPTTGILKTWAPEPNPADAAKALKEAPRTPLVDVDVATGVEGNVFAGEEPSVTIQIRNWKSGRLTGTARCRAMDERGELAASKDLSTSVDSLGGYAVSLPVAKFGRYTLRASLALSDGSRREQETVFAKLPPTKELTEEQKAASPYGLNVHSGNGAIIVPFKKAGLVWFREYAFQWDWLLRSKGADSRYAGWPYFPKIVQAYADANVKILPVIQQSIKPPQFKDGKIVGKPGPDGPWKREMGSLFSAFPQITHWELSNEYDLHNAKAEQRCAWANYRAYHKAFAAVLELMGGEDHVAVENGRAGIWPKYVRACVTSGDFDKIQVINSHHYCGTDPPEVNAANFNMGLDPSGQQMGTFYDMLRAVKQAAEADGKKRESWLTEFGWDTLAGPVVSPYEQAVFLPRAWMAAMAAGTDKAFWFYNFDTADPKVFFDGCGLMDARRQPKLSLCSMAGLASVLPSPRYVGSLDAGDNTWGYVFENEGKLVASLWTIQGDKGPQVSFKAERLCDYLGNSLEGTTTGLTMAPVYAVGLDKLDVWYKQTAYSLKTQLLMGATCGDRVTPAVTINNNRQQPIECAISLLLPDGWKADSSEVSAVVEPGAKREVELPFAVAPRQSQGVKQAKLIVREGQKLKEMPFRILVQPAVTMLVGPIVGRPGPGSATATLTNLSERTRNATLRIKTPESWNVAAPTIEVAALQPNQQREVKIALTWSANWNPEESASVEMTTNGGESVVAPLIPNEYRIYRASGIKLDGDLGDWPARTELPNWMLGSTAGTSGARVFLAWAKEGLYGAVEVHDARAEAKDPKSFWAGDALELFLDTRNDKQPRSFRAGDHQFWFCPIVGQNRVYAGRWKRGDEIAATQYDLQGIKSAARKTADGYVMEFLLPASAIQQYQAAPGGKIGVNLNLNVRGKHVDRQVYWPNAKSSSTLAQPETWGTLDLAE